MVESPSCKLCGRTANLEHVLSSCHSSLADGKFRWRHDQILAQLADGIDQARTRARQLSKGPRFIHFTRAGENGAAGGRSKGVLATANDWEMRADLKKQLKFPEEIAHTSLRQDIVLWSKGTKQVVLIELTIPWEERMEEAYERKLNKYQALILESQLNGWKTWNLPVALGLLGIEGLARKRLVANATKRAEEASRWIWMQREVRWQSYFHPAASLTAIPDAAQILVSGSVSLKCEGESEWRLSRLTGGTRLSHYRCGGAEAGSACTISSQWPQDAVYWCEFASGRFSNAVNITVQDTDVLLVSPAHPVTAGAPVSLSCCPRKQEGAPSNVFFYHDDKLVQNASGGRLSLSAVSTSDQGFYRCEHSGKMSPQSWMSVKAQRRAVELESENLLFTVLSIAGPVGGILLLILCPLVVFCYRRAKGPGRDWTYENRPQVYSSLLHGDLCVYETIGGSEMAGGGTVQNLIALKLILLLQPGI
ncbi:uncharacterized protein ACNS7B_021136 [Menidia menidia]